VGPTPGQSNQEDEGLNSQHARDGQDQGHVTGVGRVVARLVRTCALRALDPLLWSQRHSHVLNGMETRLTPGGACHRH
jgi:hypothetical protein